MEDINPTLRLIMSLREGLENGQPVRQSLQNFLSSEPGLLAKQLQKWWILKNSEQNPELKAFTLSQRALLQLIDRGFKGESIGTALVLLEQEVVEKCEGEIDEYVQALPIKCMIPLLLMIFPAYLLILLGPLVEELLRSLNQ